MKRNRSDRPFRPLLIAFLIGGWCSAAIAAITDAPVPPLTAEQVVEKNVVARGGLDAWRQVRTMVWLGHLQTHGAAETLAFVLQMKRPDKERFEVVEEGEKSIRAFDGADGWKLRPPRSGKAELLTFTPDEVQYAHDAPGIDGPLIDHQSKGIGVDLDGTEEVDGRKAYRLVVRLRSGAIRHIWVDAETFLEIRYDRQVHGSGKPGNVYVYYRDYKNVEGLQVPMTQETRGLGGGPGERMVIDKVLVNPPLDDNEFAYPGTERRKRSASSAGFGAPSQLVPPGRSGRPGSPTPPDVGSARTQSPETAPTDAKPGGDQGSPAPGH